MMENKTHNSGQAPPEKRQIKWYGRTWFIILMLFVFFPVGLYLIWGKSSWKKATKCVMTVLVAMVVISSLSTSETDKIKKPIKTVESSSSSLSSSSKKEESSTAKKNTSSKETESSVVETPAVEVVASSKPQKKASSASQSTNPAPAKPKKVESPAIIAPESTAQNNSDSIYVPDPVTPQITPEENKEVGTEYVWVTATGKKYHSNPNCGTTKNASERTLDEAEAMGLTPCSKCH